MGIFTDTPRTWVNGETVTDTLMNGHLRDPLIALSGAWTSYTPTLTGFTLGNGTVTGAYIRIGKFVEFRAQFTFGSTSAAAAAAPTLTLPVTAGSSVGLPILGVASFRDNDLANMYAAIPRLGSSTTCACYLWGGSGQYSLPNTTTPFTWAVNDSVYCAGIYEAA